MRFTAVLGFAILGSSAFIFGSDAQPRDCRISVAMADGAPVPQGLEASLFAGDRRILEAKIPTTGAFTLAGLQPGSYRLQIAGTKRSFLTSGPLHVDSDRPCQLGIDLTGRSDSYSKVVEEEVDVEDLLVSGKARAAFESAFQAFEQGRLEKAKEGFLEVIRIDPKLARAYNVLGVVLNQQGDRTGARKAFETALQLNPRSKSALLNLAKLSIAEKNYEEVLQLMDRYSAGSRDIADVHAFRAEAYFRLGRFEQTVHETGAVHGLPHANCGYVHMLAAAALEALHRPEEAVAEYQLYLAESKTDVNREVALQRIHDLTTPVASGTQPLPGNAFVSH